MVDIAAERRAGTRVVQIVFGAISLLTLIAGVTINWFAAHVPLPRELLDTVAFGLLLTAVAHALALWLWDRG
jgi:hypothetical protein